VRGLGRLDARLRTDAAAPLAVAFSGGGDSLALLLMAHRWAQVHGRRLLVITVDHGLQAQSDQWTRDCAAVAERLGAGFRALSWEGEKPAHGLPAAARRARHSLIGHAAREAGARVVLMGHTADDRLEAAAMRAAGSTTPSPREWGPSPIWPEGRGVFLLRPLLEVRRAELRPWLSAQGETWIDDPANDDLAYARSRARAELGGQDGAQEDNALPAGLAELARQARPELGGGFSLERERLRDAAPDAARAFVAAACLCAAGTSRPPRGGRLERLSLVLVGGAPVTATLAGARIEADAATVRFLREAGEGGRGGLAPVTLKPGESRVWDGRFEIATTRLGLTVRALSGLAARLGREERGQLAEIPAKARGALPALVDAAGAVTCPLLTPVEGVEVHSLTGERLLAACGGVEREPA
jgi:tRNA(Ile)-lysidine synthase